MTFQALTLPSPTGAALRLYRKCPQGALRAVVQVNHGLAEHAARYGRFAEHLAAHGFATYAHDHRGHGATTAPDAPPRMFAREHGVAKLLRDIAAVHEEIAQAHPGLPVIIFGHSMGGLIALNFVLRHRNHAAALAIWNANFSAGLAGHAARAILRWERLRLGSDAPSRLLPKLTFRDWARRIPDRQTEFDWLSRDPAEVQAYLDDPLCGWDASVSMWRDLFALVFFGADDRRLSALPRDLPINLVGGAADPATFGGRAVLDLDRRLRRSGFSNLQTTIYPATRHETLNEVNRDVVMAEFVAWLERALAEKPGS